MEKEKQTIIINNGGSFLSLLIVAFIILKLIGVISWSWWWILAPIWIPFALALFFMFIGGIIFLVSLHAIKNNE